MPQAFPLLLLGEGYLLAGRASEALDTTERALTMARERSERGHEAWALRLLGEIHARGGNVGDVETSYRQARELASELEMRPLLAHCHLGLAALPRPAAGELAAASDLFREMAMTFWLGQAETVARSIA